jgi:hypothetical protein
MEDEEMRVVPTALGRTEVTMAMPVGRKLAALPVGAGLVPFSVAARA